MVSKSITDLDTLRILQENDTSDLDEESDNENAEVEEFIKKRVRVGNEKMSKEDEELLDIQQENENLESPSEYELAIDESIQRCFDDLSRDDQSSEVSNNIITEQQFTKKAYI